VAIAEDGEDGLDEDGELGELWMWIEQEQLSEYEEDDVGPAPAHVGRFPHTPTGDPSGHFAPLGCGDPMFRHCKFQFQSIFIQPPA